MALVTKYPGHIAIAKAPQNIVFGTCQIGSEFGEVKSTSVKRAADKEELDSASGDLLAAILRKPRFELSLKTLFTLDVQPPGIAERISFPLAGVHGRIMEVTVDWEDSSGRMLSIDATSWDAFGGEETADHYNGTEWAPVVDTVAVIAPAAPTVQSATLDVTGTQLTVVFSEPVTTPLVATGLQIFGNTTAIQNALYSSGNGTNTVIYNLADSIRVGEVVKINYTQPGNGLQSVAGTDVVSFVNRAVVNNSTAAT